MVDFTNLKVYDVTDSDTVDYPLVEITGEPVLILRSATSGNKGYMNGTLRLSGHADGARRKKNVAVVIDADLMDKTREDDKELYPCDVITGWSGIVDAKGADVKFSREACTAFLHALPNWIFDGIRTYAMNPENFVDVIDSAGKSKNLQKG